MARGATRDVRYSTNQSDGAERMAAQREGSEPERVI
jgi:hypothetical protein